ncbi:hypothetical protein L1987_26545 [Smallanthus sonchifolius]|uniref:Uncharacterized protein n=1 Tax=Smallanthus sonchifolius TaxID=185202 RepID=A0ACB9IAD9_9ASTR|nr:hypothetical protein L1987_26545 [Smallanthus sonchifolius]
MTSSLSLLTPIPLPPTTNGSVGSRSVRSVFFPTKKWRCSVSPGQPPPPKHRQRQSKNSESVEKGIDPVGFLSKSGITHKGFALYLRERFEQPIKTYKVTMKNLHSNALHLCHRGHEFYQLCTFYLEGLNSTLWKSKFVLKHILKLKDVVTDSCCFRIFWIFVGWFSKYYVGDG